MEFTNSSLNRRRSRRWTVKGLGLSGATLAAMALIGCRGEEPSREGGSSQAPEAQPKRGGILRDPRYDVITGRTMDPHKETSTSNKMRRLWYQGLLGYNAKTIEVEPEIAQKWEQPSEREFIFTLQPGVKWHNKAPANGRDLTVDDVVYSLHRVRTENPAFFHATLFESVDKIEAADRSRVRVTMKDPDAVILLKFASDGPLLLAPEVVEAAGRFVSAENVVGTGPFVLQTYEDRVGAESIRNPDYWKPGRPYLDGYSYRFVGDEQAKYASFISGGLDVVEVPPSNAKDYVGRQAPGFELPLAKDNVGTNFITPNMRVKPFDDLRVARAARLLIDYEEVKTGWGDIWYTNTVYGNVLPTIQEAWDFTPEEYGAFAFWKQPKDAAIKEALDLLSASGFNRSNPLNFEVSHHVNTRGNQQEGLGVLYQAQWKRNGQGVVDAQLKIIDGAQATQVRTSGNFVYGLLSNSGAMDDPDSWLTQIVRTRGSRNYAGFSDPQIDSLIDKQRTIFDLRQRRTAVKDVLRLVAERCPVALPGRYSRLNGIGPKLRGFVPDGSVTLGRQYENVWMDS